ncbi:oligopeptidase A [Motilimonas sp. 1_MG-2023]|uniref:oligopeptidase A n=1 Tax=Motilimonas sp. 1_MG-2023 TaxID=3062672 RepID=UPI0026E1A6FE|nr:oligopeptidase A [Motilimonas sp. 1_MG-2023]MDO6525309.1 oligopeptidase A [Motilimonas sp. 1_MG-2023]
MTIDQPLPQFSTINPANIQANITQLIADNKAAIESVLASGGPYTWQNFVLPLDEVSDALGQAWQAVAHMNAVVSNDELRAAHDGCLPLLSDFATFVGQHEGLYQAYREIREGDEYARLQPEQQKLIDDTLRDFSLSGIGLDAEKKARYGEVKKRLSELASQFSNNVLDATLAWQKQITDVNELSGLPESAIQAAQELAKSKDLDGYLFTLDIPSYLPVLTYADNRSLREEMYQAFVTRASDQGPHAGQRDNSGIIDETLALRHELSQLLGFANYAEDSLATKMAQTPEQVLGFLTDLAEKSRPQAQAEIAELREFAQQQSGDTELQAWDLSYYGEKLKQHKYAISAEALRPYFPEAKVVSGLFEVVKRLFGLTITEREGVDTWHPDVRFYDIFDQQGELRGSFYFDLYAREHKRGGAWMNDCLIRRRRLDGSLQKPVAFLTCNFNKPSADKPALFTHDEVTTLFHEFGHGIHHLLTQVETSGVSGINGVPWDAVELPSQFLENWCWEPEALAFISGHYQTGEPLPQDMLDKMLAAKNYHSALMMVRQLEFSLFDFRLHLEFTPGQANQAQAKLDEVRSQVAVVTPPAYNRFQNGFSHIFAGGYAAGYYSYKWAEVLSADAFSRFEEEGIFNAQVGRDFMQHILEKGGSESPMALFTAFRGREPQVDALLRHSGIVS